METSYILIAGGSGLIGRKLSEYLYERGYQVGVLTRNPKSDTDIYWDPKKKKIDCIRTRTKMEKINFALI